MYYIVELTFSIDDICVKKTGLVCNHLKMYVKPRNLAVVSIDIPTNRPELPSETRIALVERLSLSERNHMHEKSNNIRTVV